MNPSKVTIYDENGNVLYTGRIASISVERSDYRQLECDCRFVIDPPTLSEQTPALKTVGPSYRATPQIGDAAKTIKECLAYFRTPGFEIRPGRVRIMAFMHDGSTVSKWHDESTFVVKDSFAWFTKIETVHYADFIVCRYGTTGETHILKNRWGNLGIVSADGNKIIPFAKAIQPTIQPPIATPSPKVGCVCDIKDLMSTGHNPGCPEKKK